MEKKKRTEEMKLLGVDMDIKKLQKRKLQLEVVQQEAALQMYVLSLQSSVRAAQESST